MKDMKQDEILEKDTIIYGASAKNNMNFYAASNDGSKRILKYIKKDYDLQVEGKIMYRSQCFSEKQKRKIHIYMGTLRSLLGDMIKEPQMYGNVLKFAF